MRINPKNKDTWPDHSNSFYAQVRRGDVWRVIELCLNRQNETWYSKSDPFPKPFAEWIYFDITQCDEMIICDDSKGWISDINPTVSDDYIILCKNDNAQYWRRGRYNHRQGGLWLEETSITKVIAWQPGPEV